MESGAIGYAPRFGGDFFTHAPILLYGYIGRIGGPGIRPSGRRRRQRPHIGGKGPVWELWGAARTRVSTGSAAGGDTTPECVISGPNRQARGAAGLRNVNWL